MGDRGLRIIVGGVFAWFWLNWWWTGNLFTAVSSMLPDGWLPEGFKAAEGRQLGQSVTGTVLQLAIDLLGGVGAAVIFVLSFGWKCAKDIMLGISEAVVHYRPKPKPDANAAPSELPSPVRGRRAVDLDKVADALVAHDAGLRQVIQSIDGLARRVEAIEALTVGTSAGKSVTLASVLAKQAAKKPSTPKAKPKPRPKPEAK